MASIKDLLLQLKKATVQTTLTQTTTTISRESPRQEPAEDIDNFWYPVIIGLTALSSFIALLCLGIYLSKRKMVIRYANNQIGFLISNS
jgi:hypothetical protein